MGRDKLKRNLQFKPICKKFSATTCKSGSTIYLRHEEMEALYLMDNSGLYQADAAERMGVSRPTFARIIKNARQKVSMMLISGANLVIEDEKEDYIVLAASIKEDTLVPGKPDAPFLISYHIYKNEITRTEVLKNPASEEDKRPGQILPELCSLNKANFFIATEIGTGLKSALLSKGIYAVPRKCLTDNELLDIDALKS